MSTTARQLAAIMFTDIVGYTALMGADEQKAMAMISTNREIHKKIIRKHQGRWLKEVGDGTLASFHSVCDSVYCAGELIKVCNEKGFELRIGIHMGDVIEKDGDIFGDGVNVASRLELLASPNQIIVSDPIHCNIKNKKGIQNTFIEEKQLKNVDEPVRVYSVEVKEFSDEDDLNAYATIAMHSHISLSKKTKLGLVFVLAIVLGSSVFFNPLTPGQSTNDVVTSDLVENPDFKSSIAVLSFRDMSPDQDQEYLGDGIAKEIINKLTEVRDLNVISSTSSFSFKNKETDLITIGEMLGVETILEGSVQKFGNQLRVTVQLINAEDGFHVWSESFDRELEDFFVLQEELALLVVAKIFAEDPDTENISLYNNESIDQEAHILFSSLGQSFICNDSH